MLSGKARGFGLPKHNLAPLNHTACRWYALLVLRITIVCPFFFFHWEFVCFSLPIVAAWQTVFVSPAAFVGLTVASFPLVG